MCFALEIQQYTRVIASGRIGEQQSEVAHHLVINVDSKLETSTERRRTISSFSSLDLLYGHGLESEDGVKSTKYFRRPEVEQHEQSLPA